MTFALPVALLQQIHAYLATRPAGEVFEMLAALRALPAIQPDPPKESA